MLGLDFSALWVLLANTAVVVGVITAALMVVNWFYKHPDSKYKMYEPLALQAVKFAEKAIPDNTPNKGLAKANESLIAFIKFYTENTGVEPDVATKAWFNRVKEIIVEELKKPKPVPVVPVTPK